MHQEMNVVFLAIEFQELGLEVPAHILEYEPYGVQDGLSEDLSAILGHENEMHMQVENTVSSSVNIACHYHKPMLSYRHAHP